MNDARKKQITASLLLTLLAWLGGLLPRPGEGGEGGEGNRSGNESGNENEAGDESGDEEPSDERDPVTEPGPIPWPGDEPHPGLGPDPAPAPEPEPDPEPDPGDRYDPDPERRRDDILDPQPDPEPEIDIPSWLSEHITPENIGWGALATGIVAAIKSAGPAAVSRVAAGGMVIHRDGPIGRRIRQRVGVDSLYDEPTAADYEGSPAQWIDENTPFTVGPPNSDNSDNGSDGGDDENDDPPTIEPGPTNPRPRPGGPGSAPGGGGGGNDDSDDGGDEGDIIGGGGPGGGPVLR